MFKLLFKLIVGLILVAFLYYYISPYQNCMRKYGKVGYKSKEHQEYCIKNKDW
jgi:hypothetical protein